MVILVTAADTDAHGQPPAAEQIAGRQAFRQHHGVVQLRHHHRGHQSHPVGPRRKGAQQGQAVGLSKAIRSPQHSDEKGPPSMTCAQDRSVVASN